jgi:hypothetical protein
MNDRRVRIWIAVVAGLALAVLLLLAGSAAAGPSPPVTSTARSHAAQAAGNWSSGWVTIAQGASQVFTHNLGRDSDDYAVELLFRDTGDGRGINRYGYGGLEDFGNRYGAHWQNLTTDTIEVRRHRDDDAADQIRVQVWVPPVTPTFDSGWTNIITGPPTLFTHGLGITETDLTVGLWFSSATRGIHQFGYGGLAVDPDPGPPFIPGRLLGAHWHNLTTNTVQVFRHPHDTDVEQVRVIVVKGDRPHYDSLEVHGWQPIAPGDRFTFTHGLNWNPNLLLVRGECYSPTVSGMGGIHQWLAGGNHDWFVGWQGSNFQNLTSNTVTVVRQADDQICPQVRVRVWKRGAQVYLPLVLRN